MLRGERDDGAPLGRGRAAPGRRVGEVSKLAPWQQAQVVKTIRERNPDQLQLPFALCTREAVRDLVERRFAVRLAIRTVGDYLRRWGFTPEKPVQRADERDEAAVERWLTEAYPALRARAKREGARILWGDELGIRSNHARGRSYAPAGQTPTVGKTGRRFSVNLIQAVGNRGELWFRVFSGRFSQDVFIDFLRRLTKTAQGRKLILVVDRHPAHRGKKARALIEASRELLEVVYLPGYSPDLNPAEYLNNETKHGVLSKRPATPIELANRARSHLHRRQKQPQIIRGFFRHPNAAYAA